MRRVGGKNNDVYRTPAWLFEPLNRLLHFDLDVAASRQNAKCERYYDERRDALTQPWDGRSWWGNVPYGLTTGRWVEYGRREVDRLGNRGTMLVPVKAETKWYGRHCWGRNRVVASSWLHAGDIVGRWYRLREPDYFVELLELESRVIFEGDTSGWFASSLVLFNAGPVPMLPQLARFT